jgi:NAD(P)-dependent dehydrogenase (short-subunit alcohol dehydrogenase family)
MPSVLITGSNRALGLEWARQYAEQGWRVFATCRHPGAASELQELAARHTGVSIHRMDVTRADEIRALALDLQGDPLDLLINNAGIFLEDFGEPTIGHFRYEDWELTFHVNTMGPIRVAEAFVDHLGRSERSLLATITSRMGSISEIDSPGSYYYRSSKAALNAVMRGIAVELQPRGIGVIMLHPGWVRTRMGGTSATLTPAESVQGMRAVVESFTIEKTGRFFRYSGEEIPW